MESDLTQALSGLNALAQEIRLKTFRMLMSAGENGLAAGKISGTLGIAPNKLSAHLNILTQSGLVNVRRNGRHMIYSANVAAVSGLLTQLVETCCNGHPEVCGSLADLPDIKCN